MSNTTNAAGNASQRVLNTVSTIADTVSTGVNSIGNLCKELDRRSAERLKNVNHDLNMSGEIRRNEITINAAERSKVIIEKLGADPVLAAIYSKLQEKYPS